jgi:hypothetical protein
MAGSEQSQVAALLERMERFARGEDCSLAAANFIEGEIATIFPEDDELQELAELLAQYRPGGGEFLWSEDDVRPRMTRWCEVLRQRSAQ